MIFQGFRVQGVDDGPRHQNKHSSSHNYLCRVLGSHIHIGDSITRLVKCRGLYWGPVYMEATI